MKNILKGTALAVAAATSCVAAAAVDDYVSKTLSTAAKSADSSDWSASATWSPEGEPQDNARITLSPSTGANPTLMIRSDITKEYRLLFFQNNSASSSVTIDGEAHRLLMPYSATGYYENTAFNVYAPDGTRYFFKVSDDSTGKAPVLEWTNPLVMFGLDAENCGFVDFKRGIFNFRDPGGVVGRAVEIANSYSGTKPMIVSVRKDAELRLGATTYYAGTDGDEILFDGGKGILGDVTVSYASAASSSRDVYLTLTNGATVAMDSLTETLEGSARSSVCFNLRVTGSALAVTNGDFKIAPVSGGRAVVSFEDAAFDVSNGNSDVGKGATALYENTEMNVAGKSFVRKGANVTYRNCTGSLGQLFIATDNKIWSFNEPAVVTVDGGTVTFDGSKAATGVGSGSDNANTEDFGRLVVTNGATVTLTDAIRFDLGSRYATGEMLVYDGEFKTTRNELGVGGWGGNGPWGRGLLRIFDGGKVTVGATLSVGRYCTPSTLHVDGGVLSVDGSMIFDNNTFRTRVAAVTNLYLQTAGLATIASGITMSEGGCDSEMRLEGGVTEAPYICPGTKALDGTATTTLIGDGGTLRMNGNTAPYITGLSSVKVGARGLTVDTNGKTSSIAQDIANLDDEDGVFAVKGGGTLTLAPPNAWTVSTTRIDGSTVRFPDGATTLATDLLLDNNAILSLEGGATTLTLSALTVPSGKIRLDPGDVIEVPGENLDLDSLAIEFASAPEADAEISVFRCAGTLTEASQRSILRAFEMATAEAGSHYRMVLDTQSGMTTVKTVRTADSELSKETSWQGAADSWGTGGNWSDGVPDAETKAVFANASAVKNVTVPASAGVGAVSFGADGYRLAGGPLAITSGRGAAALESTTGASEIAADMAFGTMIALTNAPGSSLLLSGNITGSGFEKSGTGMTTLSGANDLAVAAIIGGGNTKVTSVAALGTGGDNKVILRRDTLWVENAEGEAETLANGLVVRADEKSVNMAIRNETDLTLEALAIERGGLFKRGAGRLTVKVRDGMELAPEKRTASCSSWMYKFDFAENGTLPENAATDYCCGITVAQGELAFVPAEGETFPTVKFGKDSLSVGVQAADRGKARLLVDGVRLEIGAGAYLDLGYNLSNTGGINANKKPEVCVINGGEISGKNIRFGMNDYFVGYKAVVAVTNGAVKASNDMILSDIGSVAVTAHEKNSGTRIQVKDALFAAKRYIVCGTIDAQFSGTDFGASAAGMRAVLDAKTSTTAKNYEPYGTFLVDGGSVFRVGELNNFDKIGNRFDGEGVTAFTLAFDDATWDYGDGDYVLASTVANEYFRLEVRGKGVRLCPPAGTTFATEFPFTGEGGLIVDGAGTVKFAANTLKLTGTVDVRSGTLDLTAAGSLQDVPLTGSGTVKGGSFANVVLKGGSALTFDGTTFGSRLTIDFGRTEENPMDPDELAHGIEIGSFTGAAPVLPTDVRGINTGFGRVRGTVSVVGNKLVASLSRAGSILIVR